VGRPFVLQDGSLLMLAVSDVLVDGERLEGVGVDPDIVVPRELPYSAGRDPQLEAALDEAARLAAQATQASFSEISVDRSNATRAGRSGARPCSRSHGSQRLWVTRVRSAELQVLECLTFDDPVLSGAPRNA
jgi:hypothetical protein